MSNWQESYLTLAKDFRELEKENKELQAALDRVILKLFLQSKDPDMNLTREELAYAESLKFKHEKENSRR